MTFLSVLLSFLLEHYRPMHPQHLLQRLIRQWLDHVPNYCDTGERNSAKVALGILLILPALLVLMVHLWLLYQFPLLSLAWNIVVMYALMGFSHINACYVQIQEALQEKRLEDARAALAAWAGSSLATQAMTESEIVRHTLERAFIAVHAHIFGVFLVFLLPIGPAGVVIYRLTIMAEERWKVGAVSPKLLEMVQKLRYVLDWLPTRMTAAGFTIVGNFEQAAYAWRYHQKKWDTQSKAILIGTGGGALGVRLGAPLPQLSSTEALSLAQTGDIPVQELGMLPMTAHLATGASLIWRAIILWMLLLALLSIAVLFGKL